MEEGYWEVDDIDYYTVPSHTHVKRDNDTGESICDQLVYVDAHVYIDCYICASVANPTFFVDKEYGRACVFSQWRDDDNTVDSAIDTCPVDYIQYVGYDELV